MDSLPLWTNALVIAASAALLAFAANVVVDSAVGLAHRFGVSELAIGLTVVALGTSAPEFGVTVVAALENRPDISVGNIVGSNIFNLGFILGASALVCPIPVNFRLVWRDGGTLVGSSLVLLFLVGRDLSLDRIDGALFLFLLLAYLVLVWRQNRREGVEADSTGDPSSPPSRPVADSLRLLAGLASIGMASHLLVGSASAVARDLGVSEWVIAVTIVAAGTSLPELATVLAGARKGHTLVGIGNVIGSDIFNLLGVLGLAGVLNRMLIQPSALPSIFALVGMTLLTLVLLRTGWRLTRLEGALLIFVGALRWGMDFFPTLFG